MSNLELGKDIISAQIPWSPGCYPSLEIEFRRDYEYPDSDEYVFERKGQLWFAEHPTGQVRFFSHPGTDQDCGGYGGASYTLNMQDGTTQVLRGPWSSNSVVMNAAGFTPSMHCTFRGAKHDYRLAGHITRDLWLAVVRFFGVEAFVWASDDDHEWSLTKSADAYRDRRLVRAVDIAAVTP